MRKCFRIGAPKGVGVSHFILLKRGFYRVVFESDIRKMFAGAFSFSFLKIEALSSRANFFHRQSMGSPKWQHLDNSFGTGTKALQNLGKI